MPLGGLIAGVAAPIVGGLVKGGLGVGKDTTATTDYQNTSQYNPNDHLYGGYAGGLQDATANLNYREGIADTRDANTANFSGAQPDYQYAAGAASMAGADRDAASNAAGAMFNRAMGPVSNTVAAQQGAIDMRRAQAAQAAQQGSARGMAGVALAGQTAANNTANAQGQIAGQTQVNAANEQRADMQNAYDSFKGLNSMDQQARDAEIQRAQNDAALRTGQYEFNANAEQANRNANDLRAMQYEQMQQQAYEDQLNANLQNQGQLSGSFNNQQVLHAGRGARNAGNENQNWSSIGQGVGGQSPTGGPVPGKAKGGPVAAGQPYIVGEKGPELIVPQKPGYVIPNHALPPTLARGGEAMRRNGLAGMGARDTQAMLDDRALQNFQPVASTAPLHAYLAEQSAADKASAEAASAPGPRLSQAEWERRLVAGEPTAAVRPQIDENAAEDARLGVAPGTTDFETTQPKKAAGSDVYGLIQGGARGFFGGKREEGGPVTPGKAYVTGEKGPEVVVPAAQVAKAEGDELSRKGDEHGMKGIAQMLLVPGMAGAGLARAVIGGGYNAASIAAYRRAEEAQRTQREAAAAAPVYVQQPPVSREEWRRAADAKIARLADEQDPAKQAQPEQSKLAAIYDYLFGSPVEATASLGRGGR